MCKACLKRVKIWWQSRWNNASFPETKVYKSTTYVLFHQLNRCFTARIPLNKRVVSSQLMGWFSLFYTPPTTTTIFK